MYETLVLKKKFIVNHVLVVKYVWNRKKAKIIKTINQMNDKSNLFYYPFFT